MAIPTRSPDGILARPSAHALLGTNRVTWTLTDSRTAIPQLVQTERTNYDLNALMREIYDARVWAGLHWRHSMMHGAQIGRKVANYVSDAFILEGARSSGFPLLALDGPIRRNAKKLGLSLVELDL
jgi:hypothetical protein